jgi:hypothetical protein
VRLGATRWVGRTTRRQPEDLAAAGDILSPRTDSLAINAVIHSELSMAFERTEDLEVVLSEASSSVEPISREALFLQAVMDR